MKGIPGFLVIVFFSAVLTGCVSNKGYFKNSGNEFTLKVETTPCFGTCPVYELTIKESGLAVYNGKHFPNTGGEIFKSLPTWEVDSLRQIFTKNNFFELDSLYDDPHVTDLPSISINLRLGNGTEKTVTGRYDQPQELLNITAYLERLRQRNFVPSPKK